jgi:hypothetical protein
MVTGATSFKGLDKPGANVASGTIYVCDANTGNWVVYGIVYNKAVFLPGGITEATLPALDAGIARPIDVEE